MKLKADYIRLAFGSVVLVVSFLVISCASSTNTLPVNAGADGIAIKGFDSLAYFTMGKPVKGESQFAYEWKGARWLFSSREHLDLFSADPEKYAPQYGGY